MNKIVKIYNFISYCNSIKYSEEEMITTFKKIVIDEESEIIIDSNNFPEPIIQLEITNSLRIKKIKIIGKKIKFLKLIGNKNLEEIELIDCYYVLKITLENNKFKFRSLKNLFKKIAPSIEKIEIKEKNFKGFVSDWISSENKKLILLKIEPKKLVNFSSLPKNVLRVSFYNEKDINIVFGYNKSNNNELSKISQRIFSRLKFRNNDFSFKNWREDNLDLIFLMKLLEEELNIIIKVKLAIIFTIKDYDEYFENLVKFNSTLKSKRIIDSWLIWKSGNVALIETFYIFILERINDIKETIDLIIEEKYVKYLESLG